MAPVSNLVAPRRAGPWSRACECVRHTGEGVLGSGVSRATAFALSAVLALDSADRGALGALAPSIKQSFGIDNTDIGILASAFAIVGGLATIPMGVLTDRTRRMTLLVVSVVVWSMGMGVVAAAASFLVLFVGRVTLGIVSAAGGPPVTSIVGDLFAPDVRGRVFGWIKSGELVGAGIGFLVAGVVVAFTSWRIVFVILGAAGLLLAVRMRRLEEPARGGEGRIADDPDDGEPGHAAAPAEERTLDEPTPMRDLVEREGIEPVSDLVLRGDQSRRSLRWALQYVFRVRTVAFVIAAGALGEFFLAGLQVFAVVFLVGHFGISQSSAALLIPAVGAGGVAGIIVGSHLGDRLIGRGVLEGRLRVGSWSYLAVSLVFVPVFVTRSLWIAVPFLVLGSALLTAPVAPLDAARLDVVHPQLRGRAESARMICRVVATAAGPLLFGLFADRLGSGGADGLRIGFLLMLPLLAVGGVLLVFAARAYPAEVASVQASSVGVSGTGE